MTAYLDTSVLVAALIEDEPNHGACLALLRKPRLAAWTHALAEAFSTLTGGRLGLRVAPAVAAELVGTSLVPRLRLIELGARDVAAAIASAEAVGVRGGALYDYLHLVAARKSRATALYTLNDRHFSPLTSRDDPEILNPG